jgi:hypothetical protein
MDEQNRNGPQTPKIVPLECPEWLTNPADGQVPAPTERAAPGTGNHDKYNYIYLLPES